MRLVSAGARTEATQLGKKYVPCQPPAKARSVADFDGRRTDTGRARVPISEPLYAGIGQN